MPVLDVFNPTQTRTLTYYDRCAIQLSPYEMQASRLRIQVRIFASPLFRSRNFKYSLPKEFFGYAQTFFQNVLVDDIPISYGRQYIYDYWNIHGTLSHQIVDVLSRLQPDLIASSLVQIVDSPNPGGAALEALQGAIELLSELTRCFTVEFPTGDTFINTFNSPINLLRFNFPLGTAFSVTLDSWSLELGVDGSLPGNPNVAEDYDPENPKDDLIEKTPGQPDAENPYGEFSPPQSPIDPELDPDDFNLPPNPPQEGYQVRVVGAVLINNIDAEPRVVDLVTGCYAELVTAAWEQRGNAQSDNAPLFSVIVRNAIGTEILAFITSDRFGTANVTVQPCLP